MKAALMHTEEQLIDLKKKGLKIQFIDIHLEEQLCYPGRTT